jgi:hypothetical protein
MLCWLPLRADKVFQRFLVERPTEWPPLAATSCLNCGGKEESAKISVKANQTVEAGRTARSWFQRAG